MRNNTTLQELCSLLNQGKGRREISQKYWEILEIKLKKEHPEIFDKIIICPNCNYVRDVLFDDEGKINEIMCNNCLDYLSPEELEELCNK